jgi:hypothetical protein
MSTEQTNQNDTVVTGATRGRPRKYPYPSTLTCTVTGKVVKTNPTQFKKQLEQSGKTMEEYVATYVCRSARKQAKGDATKKVSDGTKKLGRPKGSKNKPKDVSIGAPAADTTETADLNGVKVENIKKVWEKVSEKSKEDCLEQASEFLTK